jgi:hypothetical protein
MPIPTNQTSIVVDGLEEHCVNVMELFASQMGPSHCVEE